MAAAKQSLTSTIFHEFHHLVRGWTITHNKFGSMHGISVAVVNESMAGVFADKHTNEYFGEAYDYPFVAIPWAGYNPTGRIFPQVPESALWATRVNIGTIGNGQTQRLSLAWQCP